MTIEEFLRKIVEIDLTQAQHVFHDWMLLWRIMLLGTRNTVHPM